MLEHLVHLDELTPLERVAPPALIDAQQRTAQWMEEVGVVDELIEVDQAAQQAREAFNAVNRNIAPTEAQKAALLRMKTPAAVRHLTGMLVAYDWDFVEQAKELRGYVVAGILEETKHPDARIRLKALQLLGTVTEVGSFTERVEITRKDASEEEIAKRLRERLSRFLQPGKDGATDATPHAARAPQDPLDAIELPPA